MAIRIAGVNIPNDKRIEIALTYVYGIGRARSNKILATLNIDKDVRAQDLTEEQVNKVRETIEKQFPVEGDLRRLVGANIKRLKEIGSYRGSRHTKRLPARGQRTKTNSRTVRGNRRSTMGTGKNKAAIQKT